MISLLVCLRPVRKRPVEILLLHGEPALAKAMATTAVERILAGVSVVKLSPMDIDRLRLLIDEADEAIALSAQATEADEPDRNGQEAKQ